MDRQDEIYLHEQAARDFVQDLRWPYGVECPYCNSERVHWRKNKVQPKICWRCRDCKRNFSIAARSLFQETQTPLNKWIALIMFMHTSSKKLTAVRAGELLNIKYETASKMMKKIKANENPGDKQLIADIIAHLEPGIKPGSPLDLERKKN